MARSLAEIDAEIAELTAARTAFLTGKRKTAVNYDGMSVNYGGDFVSTLEAIAGRLAVLDIERARLTGERSGRAPIGVGFGVRP